MARNTKLCRNRVQKNRKEYSRYRKEYIARELFGGSGKTSLGYSKECYKSCVISTGGDDSYYDGAGY